MKVSELRDATPLKLADAGDAWDKLAGLFTGHAEDCGQHLRRRLGPENWGGLAAESAADRLGKVQRDLSTAKQQLDAVGDVVRAAGQEFRRHQESLESALADAAASGYRVGDDGTVTAPDVSTDGMSGGDVAMMRRDQASIAQGYADRIGRALAEAEKADTVYADALKLFTEAAERCARGQWTVSLVESATADGLKDGLLAELGMPGEGSTPSEVHTWWQSLSPTLQAELGQDYAAILGNTDGVPATDRDRMNRAQLPVLLASLEAQHDGASGDRAAALKDKIEGLRGIQQRLAEGGEPRPYLLGVGTQGNGRAIVSFGNPDTARNVSAYVPGLNTNLDGHFARNDVKRAYDTALAARDESPGSTTASMVWLGYDAPQLTGFGLSATDVMSEDHAQAGAPAYQRFLQGVEATHQGGDPHLTAIGHSYGSLTVGQSTQQPGGIPADDIVLVGSPGVGVDRAKDLGVGADNVYIGAAANDQVTQLPSGDPLRYLAPGSEHLDEKLWFGTDPASDDFGGNHFAVEPGKDTGLVGLVTGDMPAHSLYFDPEAGEQSLENIAKVVTGNGDDVTTTRPR